MSSQNTAPDQTPKISQTPITIDPSSSQTQWDPQWELTSEDFKSTCDDTTKQWLGENAHVIGRMTVHDVLEMDWKKFFEGLSSYGLIRTAEEEILAEALFEKVHSQLAPQGKC